CEQTTAGSAHAVIRPERVLIEQHGSAGDNRVPAMVERVVFLGAATQVMLRLAPGIALQALMQNDGSRAELAQGTPGPAYLPPDATLGDLAPEQVAGDAIAGFYRTSDHAATQQDRDARRDVDRHVEVYSWGGLTSRSKIRVLWLALLPFLFANLAGWMCSAST